MRNNGQMEKVIEYVESDPKMLEYIEQVEVAEQQDQPYHSKQLEMLPVSH
ncbi:hypothetical protein [Planococcus faecalis]|nr:hypothetical protein [Planococcus faecalis]